MKLQHAAAALLIMMSGSACNQTMDKLTGGGSDDAVNSAGDPGRFADYIVYDDSGGILGGSDVLLFTGGGLTISELGAVDAPEGVKFLRAVCPPGGFWGVTVDKDNSGNTVDLSDYSGGFLKFFVRFNHRLRATDIIVVELTDGFGIMRSVNLKTFWNPAQQLNWQEITIPVASFSGVNLGGIRVPWAIVKQTGGTPVNIDTDFIRWTTN